MSEPNPVDVHVGARIRSHRKKMGLSQQALAQRLGLTFQQIQKYERGSNRISASKLLMTAEALEVDIDVFFAGLVEPEIEEASEVELSVAEFLRTREGLELSRYFTRLSADKRRGLVALVRAMAADYE